MPSEADDDDVDVLDSIFLDLDEKTKELLDQPLTHEQPQQRKDTPPTTPTPKSNLKKRKNQNNCDSMCVSEWEFECAETESARRGIRVLLSSLSRVLPQCLSHKWKAVTVSDLLTEKKLK